MSEEQTVTYELEGEIALVGLNRPDKRNCFNPTVMRQLREAIDNFIQSYNQNAVPFEWTKEVVHSVHPKPCYGDLRK